MLRDVVKSGYVQTLKSKYCGTLGRIIKTLHRLLSFLNQYIDYEILWNLVMFPEITVLTFVTSEHIFRRLGFERHVPVK